MCTNVHCNSTRIARICSKTDDLNNIQIGEHEHDGYVPEDMNLHDTVLGNDYMGFELCLDCGTIQGTWPLPETKLELDLEEDDEDDED